MNDRKLLELAAKAHGFIDDQTSESEEYGLHRNGQGIYYLTHKHGWHNWAPHTDDGDALRLAVKLDIHIEQNTPFKRACALWYGSRILREELFESWGNDKQAATRRAIVRAAAEIGAAMQQTEVK